MEAIEHDKTPDLHSDIVGGSTASRVMNCPASVKMLQRMQAGLDGEADKLLDEALKVSKDDPAKAEQLVVQSDKVRASLNQSSVYADEGTALHEVMAYLVDNDVPFNQVVGDKKVDELFDKYSLKDERMWDCVLPAYEAFLKKLDALYEEAGADAELLIRVESHVEVPGIENAFGTCDVLIRSPKRTVVWDWKFGAGVPVYASYRVLDPQGNVTDTNTGQVYFEYGNDQLMFYGRGAMNTYASYFDDLDYIDQVPLPDTAYWPVDLVICQPRTIPDGAISSFTTDVMALETFRLDLVDAVDEAQNTENPTMRRDDKWCRFAPCKAICPLHVRSTVGAAALGAKLGVLKVGRELALSANNDTGFAAPGVAHVNAEYAEALGAMLTIAEIVEPYIGEAQKQAHAFMEAGGRIPGWKLVPKRAGHDKWAEEREKVDGFLARKGLDLDARREAWVPISPAQARTKLKTLGLDMKEGSKDRKLLEKYVAPGVSSGSTVAPNDDPRPEYKSLEDKMATLAGKIEGLK